MCTHRKYGNKGLLSGIAGTHERTPPKEGRLAYVASLTAPPVVALTVVTS